MFTNKKLSSISRGADALSAINEIISAFTEYKRIAEEERTKRCEILAWEKATVDNIRAQRDLLIGYLDNSFDERSENFQNLFEGIDQAIISNNNEQLAFLLNAVVELAKSNPFNDLADLSKVKAALNDSDHTWEF